MDTNINEDNKIGVQSIEINKNNADYTKINHQIVCDKPTITVPINENQLSTQGKHNYYFFLPKKCFFSG